MRSPASSALFALALVATPALGKDRAPAGPVTDPPAVLGDAYVIDGRTFVPADTPFDDVGLAAGAEIRKDTVRRRDFGERRLKCAKVNGRLRWDVR